MAKHEPQLRDRRKPGWFYLDDAVIDQHGPTIGPYGIAVYTGLARHVNAQGETSVGYNRLATTLAMSRNKVISTLRTLADEGLITIEPQTDDSGNPIAANIYTLCVIPDQKRASGDRGVPHGGRGVPQDAPPHAQNGTPVPQDGRGVPPRAYEGIYNIDHDPTPTPTAHETKHGGDGDDFFRELRKRHVGKLKAREIASMGCDPPRILALIDNRPDANDPNSLGRLINDILDGVAGQYVPPRARAVAESRPPPAPQNGLTPEQLRELKNKHDYTRQT